MPDPADPTQPPPAPSPSPAPEVNPPAPEVNPSTTGLPSNVAAAIACIPLIGGIIFYLLEKRDSFVRFYAMQSIIFGAAWLLFNVLSAILHGILWSIPAIGGFLAGLWTFIAALVHLGLFIIMVIALFKAFSATRWDIP